MKRHEFDMLSFFSGLVIGGVGLTFLLPARTTDLVAVLVKSAVWFWPALLLATGAILLFTAVRNGADRPESQTDEAP